MHFLRLLEGIRLPALDVFFGAVTYLGDELAFMVLAFALFWCVDKRTGYYAFVAGLFGTIGNQFLKIVCRIPRPWVLDPEFQIVESARAGATGYSFPSGHTQNVVGTLGGIARWQKQKWLRAVCIALLLLTCFSRMYLGVHTPLDVGVSFGIAAVLGFVMYPIVRHAAQKPQRMYVLLGVMTLIAVAFALYANLAAFPADIDADNLYEGRKNSYSLLGALLGFLVGYGIEEKHIRFETKAVWWAQILKVVFGLLALLVCKEGLKLVFSAVGFTWLGSNAIRYFAVVLMASVVWPLTFPWFAQLGAGKEPRG